MIRVSVRVSPLNSQKFVFSHAFEVASHDSVDYAILYVALNTMFAGIHPVIDIATTEV
jgi:hypothetical protein